MRDRARLFKALIDEMQLGSVALIARQEPGGALGDGRLAQELGATPLAVSQHLRVLKNLDLVPMQIKKHNLEVFTPPCDPETERFSAVARSTTGTCSVMAHLNATLRGAMARCTCPGKCGTTSSPPARSSPFTLRARDASVSSSTRRSAGSLDDCQLGGLL